MSVVGNFLFIVSAVMEELQLSPEDLVEAAAQLAIYAPEERRKRARLLMLSWLTAPDTSGGHPRFSSRAGPPSPEEIQAVVQVLEDECVGRDGRIDLDAPCNEPMLRAIALINRLAGLESSP